MSDSNSIFVTRTSARGFAHTLIVGGLCIAAALTHSVNFSAKRSMIMPRPVLVRLIDGSGPAQPSAYDEESTMSAAQLLNRWDASITEASQRFHVPKAWIRAVMAHESGGRTMLGEDQPIVSRAGAVGLMQVLPATFAQMAEQHRLGANPFDARDNIMAGTAYLHWLHQKYGYPAMFAAYNAGPGRLEQHLVHGVKLPAETRAYVGGITRNLKLRLAQSDTVKLTRPDGAAVKVDPGQVVAIRAALPGEYAANVRSVIVLGKHKQQAIREEVRVATAAIRSVGGLI
ncbi:MAG TPA: lytic transglycosylase domain-containing protein [Rhizomicrobium sp.]|nr:lytic transglycosylase domain-containing protein [Rhizomicrobium sp.]